MGLSATWLASNWAGILDAKAFAEQAGGEQRPEFAFFTNEQAADVDAMASQIIPTDETPGAHEARCVYFIDCALTTFLRESQPTYTEGLKAVGAKTKEMFPDATSFATLTSSQQIQLLTAIEDSRFFTAVRTHTVLGMFASPAHGGNYNEVGWKLIGYEDTLNFQPPFGYYDAQSNANR
jgi:gluconate 2-dehydrogenase gamma chain